MFYSMYLSSVCQRRSWPDPLYEPYRTRHGHFCKVRVNNREYCTDVPYESEALARDGAAMKAYMICRNFSHNDGMYPGQRPGQRSSSGIVQGLPIAIGKDRGSHRSSGASFTGDAVSGLDGTSSGDTSPKSIEEPFEQQMMSAMSRPSGRTRLSSSALQHATSRSQADGEYMCLCGSDRIIRYGRCQACCRVNGWI